MDDMEGFEEQQQHEEEKKPDQSQKKKEKTVRKLGNDEISSLCLGLSMLLHAGVSVADGLSLLADEEPDGSYKDMLMRLANQVDDGYSLAYAFRECQRFPDYVCGLLDVGERAGRTEEALAALSRHYEDRARLDHQIRSALMYPAVLLVIMLAVIVVLLVQVLPVFNQVYSYLGGSLTGVAGGLLALGQALDAGMPVICLLLAAVAVFLGFFAALPNFREKVMGVWRSKMGDKGVSRKINTARVAQSLSMGLSSGLPLEEALALAASLLDSVPTAKQRCLDCQTRLENGDPLAKAMKESGVLPRAECRLLDLGMRSGTGDAAMEQIARRLSEDSEMALEELVGRVEPALVIITSILVGLILLSVMLPLMNIMTAIG